jgi:hypothetical protein
VERQTAVESAVNAHCAALPVDALRHAAEHHDAAGALELPGQEHRQCIVAVPHVEQPLAVDQLLGPLLRGQRGDADAPAIRGIETLDVAQGARAGASIHARSRQVVAKAHVGAGRLRAQPAGHVLQYRKAPGTLRVLREQLAAGESDLQSIELVAVQSRLAQQRPGLLRQAVDEFRAQFHRDLSRTGVICGVLGVHAAAHAPARFDQRHAGAGLRQGARRRQSRHSGAENRDVVAQARAPYVDKLLIDRQCVGMRPHGHATWTARRSAGAVPSCAHRLCAEKPS